MWQLSKNWQEKVFDKKKAGAYIVRPIMEDDSKTGYFCVGCSSGLGAGTRGAERAPDYLKEHLGFTHLHWKALVGEDPDPDKYQAISSTCTLLAKVTKELAKQPFFLVFSGDHSCAIGTWSGIAEAYRERGDIGLIWIDAHMDAHTPSTSPSGNIHGMPVAALMGYGDPRLTKIISSTAKIKPENLILIGIRSYEEGEKQLLEQLRVKVHYIEEVHEKGLKSLLQEAIAYLSSRTVGYGVSFDIDALDPTVVEATGTLVPNGIQEEEAIEAMQLFAANPPIAFELVEYNPLLDESGKTLAFIKNIVKSLIGDQWQL